MLEMAILLIFPAAMIFAAISDIASMTISNWVSLGLIAAFALVAVMTGMEFSILKDHLLAGGVVFLVGFACFAMGWIGGGDVKLCAVTALWLGWDLLFPYLFYVCIFGGVLTFFLILLNKCVPKLPGFLARRAWFSRLHALEDGVPYGIALAGAALVIYPQSVWFSLAAL